MPIGRNEMYHALWQSEHYRANQASSCPLEKLYQPHNVRQLSLPQSALLLGTCLKFLSSVALFP